MWWRDLAGVLRPAAAILLAGLTAACFQPVYGDRTVGGGAAVRDALAAVDIEQINAPKGTPLSRIAVETRNELVFDLQGGGGGAPSTHRLFIHLIPAHNAIILDPLTLRAEYQSFGLDAHYRMVEIVSNKTVVTGQANARVSYNVPGQTQRFAGARALRDAETRAAKVIADQIRSRLASYFVAGT